MKCVVNRQTTSVYRWWLSDEDRTSAQPNPFKDHYKISSLESSSDKSAITLLLHASLWTESITSKPRSRVFSHSFVHLKRMLYTVYRFRPNFFCRTRNQISLGMHIHTQAQKRFLLRACQSNEFFSEPLCCTVVLRLAKSVNLCHFLFNLYIPDNPMFPRTRLFCRWGVSQKCHIEQSVVRLILLSVGDFCILIL